MKQGLLAFQYEQEKSSTGMTAMSGLMTYLELMQAAGLRSSVERHVRLRERGQGWTDSQMIISLMLLNLAGGESVSDLDLLEKDEGLCKMLGEFETCGMRRRERRALEKRWRVERRRRVPSESAVFRYLSEVAEQDWQTLYRRVGEHRVDTGQQWAEVNFVPNWMGHSKTSPEYRFIAIRERLIEQPLPAMEGQMELPFPAMELSNRGWYKVFGVVTNRSIAADELIWWSRQRCGKGEEVHSVLKSDLAGGRLPSGLFGANAAWWAISVLAFNLNSAMKRLVLGGQWVGRRLKAVRFALIALPGRVMRHARRLIIRLARGHPSYELLLRARQRILALAAEPQRA